MSLARHPCQYYFSEYELFCFDFCVTVGNFDSVCITDTFVEGGFITLGVYGLTRQRIYEILLALTRRHIIHYIPRKKTPYIIYTRERQEKNRLALTREIYEDRKKSYTTRIKAMIEYATADDKCRSRMLLRYFGEKNEHNCGQCDVCLNNHHSGIKQGEFQELEQQIKQLLQAGAMPASELLNQLNSNREKAEKVLSYLLSEEIIQLKDGILSV